MGNEVDGAEPRLDHQLAGVTAHQVADPARAHNTSQNKEPLVYSHSMSQCPRVLGFVPVEGAP
ncbi:hypothetical protein MC885_006049 [Smutsia gigantea]|nr:hypothetical protein MC885_006049 [Smutsia gigantea]